MLLTSSLLVMEKAKSPPGASVASECLKADTDLVMDLMQMQPVNKEKMSELQAWPDLTPVGILPPTPDIFI